MQNTQIPVDGTPFEFSGTLDSAPGVKLSGHFRGHYKNGRKQIEHIDNPSFLINISKTPNSFEQWRENHSLIIGEV